eukprot:3750236-Ditylum_brightwellii.AAC.1
MSRRLAALKSLEIFWQEENFPIPTFCWFPPSQNGRINSCLRCQGKAIGSTFGFKKSLYVDDGALLFKSHKDMECRANLIYSHFKRFGLTMHIGENDKASNTKTVVLLLL